MDEIKAIKIIRNSETKREASLKLFSSGYNAVTTNYLIAKYVKTNLGKEIMKSDIEIRIRLYNLIYWWLYLADKESEVKNV